MARSVIQSVIFVASQQCRKFTWQRRPLLGLPGSRARIVRCGGRYDPQLVKRSSEWVSEWVDQKKSQISSKKHIILQHKNYLLHKIWYWNNKPFLRNCSLRQGTFFDAPCIGSVEKLTTVFLLAKSSHFLVHIIPAVRTRGSHFQFAFYRFAISQFANYQTRWWNMYITSHTMK